MKGKKEIKVPLNMSQKQIKRWIAGIKQLLEECEDSTGKKTLEGFIKDYEEALEKRKKFDLEADREGARLYYWTHREKCLEITRRIRERDPEKYRQLNREYSRKRREKERLEKC